MTGAKTYSLLCIQTLNYYSKVLHHVPTEITKLALFSTIYTFPSDLAPIL